MYHRICRRRLPPAHDEATRARAAAQRSRTFPEPGTPSHPMVQDMFWPPQTPSQSSTLCEFGTPSQPAQLLLLPPHTWRVSSKQMTSTERERGERGYRHRHRRGRVRKVFLCSPDRTCRLRCTLVKSERGQPGIRKNNSLPPHWSYTHVEAVVAAIVVAATVVRVEAAAVVALVEVERAVVASA